MKTYLTIAAVAFVASALTTLGFTWWPAWLILGGLFGILLGYFAGLYGWLERNKP